MGRLILNSYLYTKREKQGLGNLQHYSEEGSGYFKQQSTRPQSLGFGLGYSPIGLLAWFVEKFYEWMDVTHHTMPDHEILTFVMMHGMQGATPGLRYYKAAYQEAGPTIMNNAFANEAWTTYLATPFRVSKFPREIGTPPLHWRQLRMSDSTRNMI